MRKIKLMALLLAALMIVTAFAGCASVKKDEFDALDVRVQALEGLLKDQQTALEGIKDEIAAVNDNSEVLKAIEDLKNNLEGQIKDTNDRIDDTTGTQTGADEATKTAQQQALALIEVKRAEFAKAVDEYSAEDYVKISEALGTATGAVNAATTKTAVDAAMAALDAELGKYMTYAMKAYDYYCKLIGNVNADAGDLVEEAKAFLKDVKAVFGEEEVLFTGTLYKGGAAKTADKHNEGDKHPAYIVEVARLISEESSEARDVYLDVYNTISDLCTLYTSSTKTHATPTYVYCVVENDEGEEELEAEELYTLAAYTVWAEDLVYDINKKFGEPLVYKSAGYDQIGKVFTDYETFAEGAMILGGDKLVNLVTNNDKIVAAEEEYNNLEKAAEDFWTATKVKSRVYDHVFYYYEQLVKNNATNLLSYVDATEGEITVSEYYAKVEATLAEWKAAFNLSDENVLAIIEKAEYEAGKTLATKFAAAKSGFVFKYTGKNADDKSYTLDKHTNGLLVAAFNTFKNEIAPKIAELNANTPAEVDVDSALKYNEVEEAIKDLLILQKASVEKDAEYPANVTITLTNMDNIRYMVREAKVFSKYADEKIEKFAPAATTTVDEAYIKANVVKLYTFEADAETVTDYFVVSETTPVTVTDKRDQGDVYKFFMVGGKYDAINTAADSINAEIEKLADQTAKAKLESNMDLIKLEGKYEVINTLLSFDSDDDDTAPDVKEFTSDSGLKFVLNATADNEVTAIGPGSDEAQYALISDVLATSTLYSQYMDKKNAGSSIEAFKHHYPAFESMLDLDVFKTTCETMNARMDTLFAGAADIIAKVAAIEYIPESGSDLLKDKVDVKFYIDGDGDGVYTSDSKKDKVYNFESYDSASGKMTFKWENPADPLDTDTFGLVKGQRVSLNDYAAIKAAAAAHADWAKLGGSIAISAFDNYVDADDNELADVYVKKTLDEDADKLEDAIDLYQDFNLTVDTLTTYAAKFANDVNTIENINKHNAFTAKLSNNNVISLDKELAAKNDNKSTSYYAVTGTASTTVDNTAATKYSVIRKGDTQLYGDSVTVKVTFNNHGLALWCGSEKTAAGDSVNHPVKSFAMTKLAALEYIVGKYDTFTADNVEFKSERSEDGKTVYYQLKDVVNGVATGVYAPYNTFDAAVKKYIDGNYDVTAVKGYIFDTTSDNKDEAVYNTFRADIDGCATVAEIVNVVKSYTVKNAGFEVTLKNLDAYTVEDVQ